MENIRYIVHPLILAVVLFFFALKKVRKSTAPYFIVGLLLTVLSAFLFNYVYTDFYGAGDTLNYHHDASIYAELFYQSPTTYISSLVGHVDPEGLIYINDPRPLFFVRLMSPLYIFCGSDFIFACLYLAVFNFIIAWRLALVINYKYKLHWSAIVALTWIPTVAFWSAGMLKETVALSCLLICGWIAIGRAKNKLIRGLRFILFILAAFTLGQLKYYYFVLGIPCTLALLVHRRISEIRKSHKFAIVVAGICFIVFIALASLSHYNVNPSHLEGAISQNRTTMRMKDGNRDEIRNERFILDGPSAIAATLFRPLPFIDLASERNTFFKYTCYENVVIVLLSSISFIVVFLRVRKRQFKLTFTEIISLLFILLTAWGLGLACSNWGSLARYKVGVIPFFMLLILGNIESYLQTQKITLKKK